MEIYRENFNNNKNQRPSRELRNDGVARPGSFVVVPAGPAKVPAFDRLKDSWWELYTSRTSQHVSSSRQRPWSLRVAGGT